MEADDDVFLQAHIANKDEGKQSMPIYLLHVLSGHEGVQSAVSDDSDYSFCVLALSFILLNINK